MNLKLENISLKFSHKVVLRNLNLEFNEGKIHALLGENGAGKSTTANIIYGELQPDSGSIFIDGQEQRIKSPKEAIKAGISYVHQLPAVAESISIFENIKIGLNKDQISKIKEYTDFWLPQTNTKSLMAHVGADVKFFTALICALIREPSLLILDEPTALLDKNKSDFLFKNLKTYAAKGMNIIVITHNIYEAETYCDEIFCLENGGSTDKGEYLSKVKMGTVLKNEKEKVCTTGTVLKNKIQYKALSFKPSTHPAINNISFNCYSGEITLIQGMAEDGMLTLENIITGMEDHKIQGAITFSSSNKEITVNLHKKVLTPRFIRYSTGIKTSIIPTNRKFRGANPLLSITEILSEGENFSSSYINELINQAKINIKADELASNLSGGMQQRLIITRELSYKPEFLILCHPLQGLDPQTCELISEKITAEAKKGTAILILSAGDFSADLCDYVYKLTKGNLEQIK